MNRPQRGPGNEFKPPEKRQQRICNALTNTFSGASSRVAGLQKAQNEQVISLRIQRIGLLAAWGTAGLAGKMIHGLRLKEKLVVSLAGRVTAAGIHGDDTGAVRAARTARASAWAASEVSGT